MHLPLAHRDMPRREICKMTISPKPQPLRSLTVPGSIITDEAAWAQVALNLAFLSSLSSSPLLLFLLFSRHVLLSWLPCFPPCPWCLLSVSCLSWREMSGFLMREAENDFIACATKCPDAQSGDQRRVEKS